MHAWLLAGLLSGALASTPTPTPTPATPAPPPAPAAAPEAPWKARLTAGFRAVDLDSPQPMGLSFLGDAQLELRMFGHVAVQVGTWPLVVPVVAANPLAACQPPAPAAFRVGVSEFGDGWELGAMASATFNVNDVTHCQARRYLVITPFFRFGRDQDFGVDGGVGFYYLTPKEVWLGAHAPLGPMRAFLDARVSLFGWAAADLGVEVPGALVGLPRALSIRVEAGVGAVGGITPSWRLGPQGGLGMSWTW